MDGYDLYMDMKQRTGGEIYIGVVGPVRTGKSTFIKKFMEEIVLPLIEDEAEKTRAVDELPQSAKGRTIMTTEPKFIPKNAAKIVFRDGTDVKIRLIDCVGYMVEGAAGHLENEKERLVKTPWSTEEIPFTKAAEIGTGKVIREHSTVGVLVTSDGSFGELTREGYAVPEERTILELKALGKPFVVLLNSAEPTKKEVIELADTLSETYDVTVLPVNCIQLKKAELLQILEELLNAFPVSEMRFRLPKWAELEAADSELKQEALLMAEEIMKSGRRMKDISRQEKITEGACFDKIAAPVVHMDTGLVEYEFLPKKEYYYRMLGKLLGCSITGEYKFYRMLAEIAQKRTEYEKVSEACAQVEQKGYGLVLPDTAQFELSEPELFKSVGKYGVKIRATAPSVHMIKANIVTEIAPIVGSEEQAKDLIGYMLKQKEDGEEGIRGASIFGKSVDRLVEEGVNAKIANINEECQTKLQESIEKIINDSNGGVICFII